MREGDRTEDLLQHVPWQPNTDRRQSARNRQRVLRAEFAVLEQAAGDLLRQERETGSGGQRQSGGDLIGAGLRRSECSLVAGVDARCYARHDHHRNRHSGNAERQFVQPVGIVQPRHGRR